MYCCPYLRWGKVHSFKTNIKKFINYIYIINFLSKAERPKDRQV